MAGWARAHLLQLKVDSERLRVHGVGGGLAQWGRGCTGVGSDGSASSDGWICPLGPSTCGIGAPPRLSPICPTSWGGPVWFWMRTESPHRRGDKPWVCSSHLARPRVSRFETAQPVHASRVVPPGWSVVGSEGGFPESRSRVDLPKRHRAGDMPVSGLGQFWYCSSAL